MTDVREPGDRGPSTTPAEPSADPQDSQLGPAPEVAGSDRLRSALRARMFGDLPDGGDDETDGEGASRADGGSSGADEGASRVDEGASGSDEGSSGSDDGFGPAPEVAGAGRIRADLRARLFGDDSAEVETDSETDPEVDPSKDAADDGFGAAPEVAGAGRMRADLRARLFGDLESDSDAPDDEDDTGADGAGSAGARHKKRKSRDSHGAEPDLAGSIGRFRVLDRLGSGGMGVVYSAYDPELDRKVAIKLLRPDVRQGMEAKDAQARALGDESEARMVRDAQARLMREAQAMARLSDPHVIVVHEVGSVADGVFVAMEFIDGQTLGAWIEQGSHPWREVLDVFIKAGSGLAAAHRADLVHRDFKPDNVLLGNEGQVRVLDFGLARSMTEGPSTATPAVPVRERPDLDTLGTPLTRTGAVMGTPAYMSPEQYLGYPADARSDQFSFCVALYEGLYGVRPFEGKTLMELSENVVSGRIRATPTDARVPKRLLGVLRRGLAHEPDERYPSMEALLAELRRDPARRWRWGGLIVGVGALTSLVTLAATGTGDAAEACSGLERELEGIWDDAARAEVTAAIEGTGLDYAPRVARTTLELLDDYAQRWVSMAADACGAALVAKDDAEHQRRRLCLDQRLAEVEALVEALRQPDGGMAEAAVKATTSLTSGLSACADPRRLAAYAFFDDPATRKSLAQAHATMARAKAQGVLGHYARAIELATEVVEVARAADAGPLEAQGLLLRGTYEERADDPKRSEADLRRAVDLADRHGDPGTRAQALIMLVYVVAQDRTRYVEARMLGDQARAVLEYIDADPLLLADLDNNLGVAARIEGDFDTSLSLHRRSHERRVEVLGEQHPDIGRSLLNIGIAMGASREHYAQAEEYLRKALKSLEQSQGPMHPIVGTALTNLGNCLGRQGRIEQSLPLQQRALSIFEGAFGPDHVATLRALFNLARLMQKLDRHEEAATLLRRGLAAHERELSPDDVRLKPWVSHLGRSELSLGRHEQARPLLERSLTLRQADKESAVQMSYDRLRLAQALWPDEQQRARARGLAREALEALEAQAARSAPDPVPKKVRRWLAEADQWLVEHPLTAAEG